MELDVNRRRKQLEAIETFARDSAQHLDALLTRFGWSRDYVEKADLISCPNNSDHQMPKASLEKHLIRCEWKAIGYNDEEIDKLPASSSFYHESHEERKPVLVEESLQEQILGVPAAVPLDPNRACLDLTSSQRLAIYQYIVGKSSNHEGPVAGDKASTSVDNREEASLLKMDLFASLKTRREKDKEPSNRLAFLALQRDLKRRRASYKGKNVHITSKSYTETLREVIENQSEYLRNEFAERSACESRRNALHGDRGRRGRKEKGEVNVNETPFEANDTTKSSKRSSSRSRSRSNSRRSHRKHKHRHHSKHKDGKHRRHHHHHRGNVKEKNRREKR